MWVIARHSFHTIHIDNKIFTVARYYIRTRMILHIKAYDQSLGLCARLLVVL